MKLSEIIYNIMKQIKKLIPLKMKIWISWFYCRYLMPLPKNCRIPREIGINLNKRDVEVVVSLTSYPARITTVHMTIMTVLNQIFKPDKVILWLASEQFPNGESSLPKKLLDLKKNGLTIAWTHDIRSYKKLIPTLRHYPNAIIITCDDDTFYPEYWLQMLMESYDKHPNCVHCHRGHTIRFNNQDEVLPFLKWEFESINSVPSYLNFQTGIGGVLYPPNCLDNDVFDEDTFMRLAKTCDDHWFWAMAVKNGTRIKIVDGGIRKCLVNHKASTEFSLCLVNTGKDMMSNDDKVFAVLCNRYNLKDILLNERDMI